jgi:hypothetical protein
MHLPGVEVRTLPLNKADGDEITVVLGTEYDDESRTKLSDIFQKLCAVKVSSSGKAVVGSQEIEQWEVTIDRYRLFVESETYIGLSIGGPRDIVQRIQELLSIAGRAPHP